MANGGKLLSSKDEGRIEKVLRVFEHGNRGSRYRRRNISSGAIIKIFEVQSAATGDGVYNCYEVVLDATDWADTSGADKFNYITEPETVEVFNFFESDPISGYTPALAKYDLLVATLRADDEGNMRWMGIPCVEVPRRAITTQAAPADTKITANLYDRHGNEITGGLGSAIEVNCDITGGEDLQGVLPYLDDDQPISVYNKQGKWWCTDIFQKWDICE